MKPHKTALYVILTVFAIVTVFLLVMVLIECSKALTHTGRPEVYHEVNADDSDSDEYEYTTKRKAGGKNKQY